MGQFAQRHGSDAAGPAAAAAAAAAAAEPQPGGGGAAAASGGPLFYYRTYDNMQWKRIELGRIDFSKGRKFAPIQLYEPGLGIKDATPVS